MIHQIANEGNILTYRHEFHDSIRWLQRIFLKQTDLNIIPNPLIAKSHRILESANFGGGKAINVHSFFDQRQMVVMEFLKDGEGKAIIVYEFPFVIVNSRPIQGDSIKPLLNQRF